MGATIIKRRDASKQGLKRYFTGKPCRHGHIDERLISNKTCLTCIAKRVRAEATRISRVKRNLSGEKAYVYLMKDATHPYVKIGYSKNPRYRERTLQAEKPTIEILEYWEGSRGDEKNLHRFFKNKRFRGEWFSLEEEDIDKIRAYFVYEAEQQQILSIGATITDTVLSMFPEHPFSQECNNALNDILRTDTNATASDIYYKYGIKVVRPRFLLHCTNCKSPTKMGQLVWRRSRNSNYCLGCVEVLLEGKDYTKFSSYKKKFSFIGK